MWNAEKLICAFPWSVLPSIMKMHGPKNKTKKKENKKTLSCSFPCNNITVSYK